MFFGHDIHFRNYNINKVKLAFLRASMKNYYDWLSINVDKKTTVKYIDYDNQFSAYVIKMRISIVQLDSLGGGACDMERRIPPLAFNDHLVPTILDFNAYRADRERVLGRPVDAEPLCPEAEFGAKASRISINGLELVAKSHSPVRSQRVMPGSHLWILQHSSCGPGQV
jgi:hypothetical protein